MKQVAMSATLMQVKRSTANANQLFNETRQSVQWTITAAADNGNMTASYRASHSLMLLLVERASQLQVLKQPSVASVLARSKTQNRGSTAEGGTGASVSEHIHQQQLDLLQQAEAVGQKAQQLFAAQKRQWMQNAESAEERDAFMSMQHDAIEAVQGLLQKLPEVKANFVGHMDASEVAAMLAVLMKVSEVARIVGCHVDRGQQECSDVGQPCVVLVVADRQYCILCHALPMF